MHLTHKRQSGCQLWLDVLMIYGRTISLRSELLNITATFTLDLIKPAYLQYINCMLSGWLHLRCFVQKLRFGYRFLMINNRGVWNNLEHLQRRTSVQWTSLNFKSAQITWQIFHQTSQMRIKLDVNKFIRKS